MPGPRGSCGVGYGADDLLRAGDDLWPDDLLRIGMICGLAIDRAEKRTTVASVSDGAGRKNLRGRLCERVSVADTHLKRVLYPYNPIIYNKV